MKVRIVRYLPADDAQEWTGGKVLGDTNDLIELTLGEDMFYEDMEGRVLVQKDYRVSGEIWQVHKTDADPFPSWPHAHCVGGRERYVGLKLHLGTRQLWQGARPMDMLLPKKPFARLIELIRPKFPNIELPLEDTGPVQNN